MNGTETCTLEDDIAIQLDGRDGAKWLGIYLAILADAGISPVETKQAQQDLARAQRALDAALSRVRTERAALPRGRTA